MKINKDIKSRIYFGNEVSGLLFSEIIFPLKFQKILLIINSNERQNEFVEKIISQLTKQQVRVDLVLSDKNINLEPYYEDDLRHVIAIGFVEELIISQRFAVSHNINYSLIPLAVCDVIDYINNLREGGHIYINYEIMQSSSIDEISNSCAKIFSLIGYMIDYKINSKLFKSTYDLNTFESIKTEMSVFLRLLSKVSHEPSKLLELQDCFINLSFLFYNLGYNDKSCKEKQLYNTYCQISGNKCEKPSYFYLLSLLLTIKLYKKFFGIISYSSCTLFDIEKRIKEYDKYFLNNSCNYDFLHDLDYDIIKYKLEKFKPEFNVFISTIESHISKYINMILQLSNDYGYNFSKSINEQILLQSVYFTPDVISGDCVYKLIKDFGLLDYEVG